MKKYIHFFIGFIFRLSLLILLMSLLFYKKPGLVVLVCSLFLLFDMLSDTPKKEEDEIEISIKNNCPIATVKLVDNKSGIVQAVYENEKNKIIICETSPYNFLTNEEKQIEMYCYNLNNEKLSELKLVKYNFIEE
mgnify:CR=1 FL=1